MLFSAGCSVFTTGLDSRIATPGLWLATIFAFCGCAESPLTPSKPSVDAADSKEKTAVEVTLTDSSNASVPAPLPNPVDPVVPSETEMSFEGLSASQKLDRIAEVIRSSWGEGKGFLYVPETANTESTEDPLVLTLRWHSVEKKVAPLIQRAFGIEGTLVCRFTSPGEFECNHPVYQLAIQRAQKRSEEFAVIHRRADATLVNTAPILREQFLQKAGQQTSFYDAIRSSLKTITLPGQLEFSGDETDSLADDQQCVLFTKWTALPAEYEKSTEVGSFQWRLKLVVREAVDALESEWDNLRSEKNRLELVSYAQYRRDQDEPFELVGPLSISAMGLAPDTTIHRWGKRYNSLLVPANEVLESLEQSSRVGDYPNPATLVGVSDPMQTLVKSVHQAIQQHLTEKAAE
jgi:hypothetical protein